MREGCLQVINYLLLGGNFTGTLLNQLDEAGNATGEVFLFLRGHHRVGSTCNKNVLSLDKSVLFGNSKSEFALSNLNLSLKSGNFVSESPCLGLGLGGGELGGLNLGLFSLDLGPDTVNLLFQLCLLDDIAHHAGGVLLLDEGLESAVKLEERVLGGFISGGLDNGKLGNLVISCGVSDRGLGKVDDESGSTGGDARGNTSLSIVAVNNVLSLIVEEKVQNGGKTVGSTNDEVFEANNGCVFGGAVAGEGLSIGADRAGGAVGGDVAAVLVGGKEEGVVELEGARRAAEPLDVSEGLHHGVLHGGALLGLAEADSFESSSLFVGENLEAAASGELAEHVL